MIRCTEKETSNVPFKIWASAKSPKPVWISANLPKKIAQVCPNLKKICPNAGKIFPKVCISLSSCKVALFRRDNEQSLKNFA